MLNQILKAVFGTKSKRDLKRMAPLVRKINAMEVEYQKLTDEELRAKTDEFKARLANGETLDDIMCEAFAAVKNACRRLVGKTEVGKPPCIRIEGVGGQYLRSGLQIFIVNVEDHFRIGDGKLLERGIDEKVPAVDFGADRAVENHQ